MDETRAKLKSRTTEAEVLRSQLAELQAEHAAAKEQHAAELGVLKGQHAREVEKLQQSVAAIARCAHCTRFCVHIPECPCTQSGRGRLEQLSELHQDLERRELEWNAERTNLNAQIASLSAEIEGLAESNAQLTAALEGSEKLESLGSRLDAKSTESHVKQLEKDILTKIQIAEEATAARDGLVRASGWWFAFLQSHNIQRAADQAQRLDTATQQLQERNERCRALDEALAQTRAELSALKSSSSATASELASREREARSQLNDLGARCAELERLLATSENALAQAGAARDAAQAELRGLREGAAAEAAEREAERTSIRERLNEAIQERWQASSASLLAP